MLLLYALARPIASSLSAASANDTSFDPVTGKCIDINECRTTTSILWSCLSVVFICTWVAIHPNIPIVDAHWAAVIYQNIQLMVIALLAPEFMILWAMRQRASAKAIGNKFSKYGWGMTHGFLVIMGGFALYDGEQFCGYLWNSMTRNPDIDTKKWAQDYAIRIESHHEHMRSSPDYHSPRTQPQGNPMSDKDGDISAEGKPLIGTLSDASCLLEFLVAKGYITITEDEIKEKSHADFIAKSIAIIQTTWFILQVVARAVEGLAITEIEIITVGFAILNFGTYYLWWNKPLRVRYPVRVYWRQKERVSVEHREHTRSWIREIYNLCQDGSAGVIDYIYASDGFFDDCPDNILIRILLLPLWSLMHMFFVCVRILQDNDDRNLAIPISSGLNNDPRHLYISTYGIAAVFGTIHCIPWAFQFPTDSEQLLWRIAAVAVAAAPILMGVFHGYVEKVDEYVPDWIGTIVGAIMACLSLAYAIFRVALIILAFVALRDLSASAYQTVQWITFIPHIG